MHQKITLIPWMQGMHEAQLAAFCMVEISVSIVRDSRDALVALQGGD